MINGSKLVQHNVTGFPTESTGDAIGIGLLPGGQGSDNGGAQMMIELVGRDHEAGARLTDLTSANRIQLDEKYLANKGIDF